MKRTFNNNKRFCSEFANEVWSSMWRKKEKGNDVLCASLKFNFQFKTTTAKLNLMIDFYRTITNVRKLLEYYKLLFIVGFTFTYTSICQSIGANSWFIMIAKENIKTQSVYSLEIEELKDIDLNPPNQTFRLFTLKVWMISNHIYHLYICKYSSEWSASMAYHKQLQFLFFKERYFKNMHVEYELRNSVLHYIERFKRKLYLLINKCFSIWMRNAFTACAKCRYPIIRSVYECVYVS